MQYNKAVDVLLTFLFISSILMAIASVGYGTLYLENKTWHYFLIAGVAGMLIFKELRNWLRGIETKRQPYIYQTDNVVDVIRHANDDNWFLLIIQMISRLFLGSSGNKK
jgi:hypothetical protein